MSELRFFWRRQLGTAAPANMRRGTLVKALAYHLQAQAYGDLPNSMLRELHALAKPMALPPRIGAAQALQPGTRLLRMWRGTLHEVTVREDGYEWAGEVYSSLSRVAREITSVRWNGPRFFGLRMKAQSIPEPADG